MTNEPLLHTPDAVRDFLAARDNLFRAFQADHRNGVSGNRIAEMAAGTFSRPVLQDYFATLKLRDDALDALKKANLVGVVDVGVTGPVGQGSREVYALLARDPAEFSSPAQLTELVGRSLEVLAAAGVTVLHYTNRAAVAAALVTGTEVTLGRP